MRVHDHALGVRLASVRRVRRLDPPVTAPARPLPRPEDAATPGPSAGAHAAAAQPEPRARALVDRLAARATPALVDLQLRVGVPEPGLVGSFFALAGGDLAALASGLGVALGWAGAAIGTVVHAVHGSLLGAAATELVLAKAVDYGLSNGLRRADTKAEPYYAAMARAGLEAGWSSPTATLPWWFGSVSYGATGALDFMIANVLGAALRSHFDGLVASARARGVTLGAAKVERLEALYLERVPRLAARIVSESGADLDSPLLRNLVKAASGDVGRGLVEAIQRRLVTERPGDPILGVTGGHALAGGIVGCVTGEPLLGAAVALVDASAEAMLMRAATQGRFSTLMKVKAELLGKGWDGAALTASQRVTEYYTQTAQEMRRFGGDLRAVADARLTASAGEVSRALASLDALFVQQLGAEPGTVTRLVEELFQRAAGDLDRRVSAVLDHHAEQPLGAAIHQDFPELEVVEHAARHQARAVVMASWLRTTAPEGARASASARPALSDVPFPPERP